MNKIDIDQIATLANLETIRSARIEPLQLRVEKTVISATEEILKLPKLRPDRIHVITNICVLQTTAGKGQVFIGILSKNEEFLLMSYTPTVAEDAVTWAGQAIGLEYDEIYTKVQGATATDKLILVAFGYSMRF